MTRLLIAVALAAFAGVASVHAQPYPARPIIIVAPYGAGGTVDTLARILGERMRVTLGQPVVVENTSGAAGTVGVTRVARAAPDGYTIGIGNWGTHVVTPALQPVQFDVLKDFAPVAMLPSNPYLIISRSGVPAKDLKEFVAWLKASQGKVTSASGGNGSPNHVIGLYFQKATGTDYQFVPYRGGMAPSMQDIVAGQVDMTFAQPTDVLPHRESGRVRTYAVMAKTRLEVMPDTPTVDEAGMPGLHVSTWYGFWAPAGTPPDAIAKLNAAVVEALADPAVRQRIAALGQELPPREQQGPEALGAHHKAEIEKWWPIIRAGDIKAQ